MIRYKLSCATALLIGALSFAPMAHAASPLNANDYAIGLGLGSEGIGATLTAGVIPGHLNLNVGFSRFSYNYNFTDLDAHFNSHLVIGGEPLTLSFYPLAGVGFNIDAGVIINQNAADVTGVPEVGGSYTINGRTYTASEVGSLTGKTHFNTVAPYVGIGWGNPVYGSSRWTFVANAGAMYEGNPGINLTATGAISNPQLASDVRETQNSLNSRLNFLNWWPVVTVGLTYRF